MSPPCRRRTGHSEHNSANELHLQSSSRIAPARLLQCRRRISLRIAPATDVAPNVMPSRPHSAIRRVDCISNPYHVDHASKACSATSILQRRSPKIRRPTLPSNRDAHRRPSRTTTQGRTKIGTPRQQAAARAVNFEGKGTQQKELRGPCPDGEGGHLDAWSRTQ